MSDFKVYNLILDKAIAETSINTESYGSNVLSQNLSINNTIYEVYNSKDNVAPLCPTGYVYGNYICLPSLNQLNTNTFVSNDAILSLYFIQSFVYLYKNYSPTGASIFPYIPPYDNDVNTDNSVKSTITTYLSNAIISNITPKCVKTLTYTSQIKSSYNVFLTTYGGCILEYQIGNILTSFIILRGTQETSEWHEDAQVTLEKPLWLTDYPTATVHSGFNSVYTSFEPDIGSKNLRDQISEYLISKGNSINNLIITGHSLGSGITYLLAADISTKLELSQFRSKTKFFPFAGPYSGNQNFVNLILNKSPLPPITQLFAVINTADPVPTTKLPFYQRISSQFFFFTDKGIGGSYPHLPSTYRKNLELAASTFNTIGNNTQISYP